MEEAPAAPLAAEPAPAEQQQASPFLRCLSQLNDDVLATYLLPKLVDQGSACAVVLTCSQLRALCQPSIQHLDLSKPQLQDADNPCHTPEVARQLVASFPQCTSLAFAWSGSSMASVYRNISTLLRGLPNLSTVSISLDDDTEDDNPDTMLDPVLCQLHMHATALRSLCLQLSTGWLGDDDMTWASLGKLATLKKLQVAFDREVCDACTQLHLRHLTGLTQLQSLTIQAPGADMVNFIEDATLRLAVEQFPGRLTALTQLQLPLETLHNIRSISACVNLRDLQLICTDENVFALENKECAALAQLTRLSRLIVQVALIDLEHAEPFYGVLRQLPELRDVGAECWTPSALPVLQSLTQLTAVHGGWQVAENSDLSATLKFTCAHIRELGEVYGNVPFQVFPNTLGVSHYPLTAACMQALSRYCTRLQKLALAGPAGYPSYGSPAERIAAFRSLAQLKCLSHLELAATDSADLIAFTSAAAAGDLAQLQYLHVRGELSLFALMQLPSVRGLQELSVHLIHSHPSFLEEGVGVWLVGLAVVPSVSLELCSEEQRGVVEAAREWVVQSGLPLPAALKVAGTS